MKKINLFNYINLILALAVMAFPPLVWSQTPVMKIEHHTSGEKITEDNWIQDLQWLWAPSYEYNLVATPVLRLVLAIPFNFKVTGMDVDLRLIHEELDKQDGKTTKRLTVDIPFYYRTAKLKILKKNGAASEIKINMLPEGQTQLTLVHESCINLGISFLQKEPPEEEMPNIALTCLKEPQFLLVNIQHPVGWNASSLENSSWVREGKFRSIIKVNIEGREQPIDGTLVQFFVRKKAEQKSLEYRVNTDGRIFGHFDLKIGVGLVSTNFREPKANVSFSSMLLKVLLEGSYDFRTSPFLIEGDLRITPFSFYSSQADQRRATFTEANIDFSRKFFRENRNWYSAGLGWFYWGMLVSPAGWGVDYLAGPRVAVSFHNDVFNQAEYLLRGSVSLVHSESTVNLRSIVVAAELLYEISKPGSAKPYFLHIEGQSIDYQIPSLGRSIASTSWSVGATTTF